MPSETAVRRETLNQIIETQPSSEQAARARYELGGMQLEVGNVESATGLFRKVPSNWPHWHSRAALAIARIYDEHVNDIDAATREYRKVIRLHPDSFPAGVSYARMADLHEAYGDAVSAENMRECAMRTFEKIVETSTNAEEKAMALDRYVQACRQLEQWDQATETLIRARRAAVKDRQATRRVELDHALGLLYLDREQYGNALMRFRTCLQHYRRRGEDVEKIVTLSELTARCQRGTSDIAGARRTYRSLVDYVQRGKERRDVVQRDPQLAAILARAYRVLDLSREANQLRTRLRRMKGVKAREALAAVEGELTETA